MRQGVTVHRVFRWNALLPGQKAYSIFNFRFTGIGTLRSCRCCVEQQASQSEMKHFPAKRVISSFINQEELHRVASEDDQLVYRTVIFPLQALTFSESDASQTYLEQLIQGTQRFPVQLTRKKDCDFLYALLYQIQNAAEQKSSGYELMVKALLLQMIAQMFCRHMMIPVQHAPSEKSQRLKEMLQYIRQHYAHRLQSQSWRNNFICLRSIFPDIFALQLVRILRRI